jgi:alanyl-tRNA synthetase
MSEPIYYQNPYARTLRAEVTHITDRKGGWAIELDRTIFYPEGGGQPGDRGRIGSCEVVTTRKDSGRILHITSKQPEVRVGEQVDIELDWEHRYDYMQQHTGQHLISGAFYSVLGIGTVSVHQGQEYTTIDVDRSSLTDEQILQIEQTVEQQIISNEPVLYHILSEQEASGLNLRREPKVTGDIRVVEIQDCDTVACGGIHLKRTGEVQLARCIGTETIRNRVRTIWKIGGRAVADYRMKDSQISRLVALLSAQPDTVAEQAVAKLEQLKQLQSDYRDAESLMASMILERSFERTDESSPIVTLDLTAYPEGILKQLMTQLPEDKEFALCAVRKHDERTVRWMIAVSGGITTDFSMFREHLFPIIHAKGGGKPPVWQGAGVLPDRSDEFLQAFGELMRDHREKQAN